MKLLSVNVGGIQSVSYRQKTVTTGIFKTPVSGRVSLTLLNLEGDEQADLEDHGGRDKAVYFYSYDNYPYWSPILGNHFVFGQFGENFTVSGMLDTEIHLGDIFQVGEAIVQVTQPRIPCYKLGLRLDKPDFPQQFLESGRTGFYAKVLQEGSVGEGDEITCLTLDPQEITVYQAVRLLYFEPNREDIERILSVEALSGSWRQSFTKKLPKIN